MQDAGCRMQDAGDRLQEERDERQDAGSRKQDTVFSNCTCQPASETIVGKFLTMNARAEDFSLHNIEQMETFHWHFDKISDTGRAGHLVAECWSARMIISRQVASDRVLDNTIE